MKLLVITNIRYQVCEARVEYFKVRIVSFIAANVHTLPHDYIIYIFFLGMTEYNQSFLHSLPFLLKFFLKELSIVTTAGSMLHDLQYKQKKINFVPMSLL